MLITDFKLMDNLLFLRRPSQLWCLLQHWLFIFLLLIFFSFCRFYILLQLSLRFFLHPTQVLIKDLLQYRIVPLDGLTWFEWNARLTQYVVEQLLGNHACCIQVYLAKVIKVHYEGMCCVYFKSLVRLRAAWALALLHLHHLHHHSHGTRLLPYHNCWCILQPLGKRDFLNCRLELGLEPEAKTAHIFFRQSAGLQRFVLPAEVFRDLVVGCLNIYESLSLIVARLLEAELINLVCEDEHWEVWPLEGLHERRGHGLIIWLSEDEINLVLTRLKFLKVILKWYQFLLCEIRLES